jgi:hypothetical protein
VASHGGKAFGFIIVSVKAPISPLPEERIAGDRVTYSFVKGSYIAMSLTHQLISLFVLAIPIACVTWTITHEEVFREPREWCVKNSQTCRRLFQRKFFYLFTCEYCFSHYVTVVFLLITRYKLLYGDWKGYLIGGFSLVWIANMYMGLLGRLRLDIKQQRIEIAADEQNLENNLNVR